MNKLALLASLIFLGAFSSQISHGAILECIESCQRFDFDGTCTYRTQCQITSGPAGDCMTTATCAQFDFDGKCRDEVIKKVCAVPACPQYPVPAPQFPIACESQCQKRDITGNCVYFTGCEIQGRCMHQTECQRFDAFNQNCLSEKIQHTCY